MIDKINVMAVLTAIPTGIFWILWQAKKKESKMNYNNFIRVLKELDGKDAEVKDLESIIGLCDQVEREVIRPTEIIFKKPREGKTTSLIKKCAIEGGYIVCRNRDTAKMIVSIAEKMKYNIPLPITYNDFTEKRYDSKIKKLHFDDIDGYIQGLSEVRISTMTLCNFQSTRESSKKHDQRLLEKPRKIELTNGKEWTCEEYGGLGPLHGPGDELTEEERFEKQLTEIFPFSFHIISVLFELREKPGRYTAIHGLFEKQKEQLINIGYEINVAMNHREFDWITYKGGEKCQD